MIERNIELTGRIGRKTQLRGWHAFIAPEIQTRLYHDHRCDLWSFGAILYTMLCGSAPIIKDGALVGLFEVVQPSSNAQDLVKRLLQINPNRRMKISAVLAHPWMTEDDDVLAQADLGLAKIIFGDYTKTGR